MKVNWMIWPLVTSVNLYFVPPIYRILCVNFFALWWNLYLSVLNKGTIENVGIEIADAVPEVITPNEGK